MELDKELLTDFCTESNGLVDELEAVVEKLEEAEGFPVAEMKEFAQKVDRIMGTAKTILMMAPGHPGITFLSVITEMCKTIGYQAVALNKAPLVPIFAGFWAETVEVMRELLAVLDSPEKTQSLIQARSASLQKRLTWLADKVAPNGEEEKAKVVALLKKL